MMVGGSAPIVLRQGKGYGNDSRQTGPLSSRILHNDAAGRFAFT